MARVMFIEKDDHELRGLHKTEVSCKYIVSEYDGHKVLQLNSYGSMDRQIPGKLSQTFQFDETVARQLWDLLEREFAFSAKPGNE